jgi:N-acetylmuramidase/Putative peptidoglycan binding domain
MTIIKKGDTGAAVRDAQKALNQNGANITVDGWFGDVTEQAVIAFQLKHNLPPVGQIGPRTMAALQGKNCDKLLLRDHIINAAAMLEVEPACLAAVAQVESAGSGFFSCGRPAILFERHVFYKQLQQQSQELADEMARQYPQLCNTQRGGYVGGPSEYQRFNMAHLLNPVAAIEACSWGMFQIMGFHWQLLGFDSPKAMMQAMGESEARHLQALTHFILADSVLHKALKGKKWAEFAKRYNGPAYTENNYDMKLSRAYLQMAPYYEDTPDAAMAE